jgi:protein-S-isoprenylcysteine O-methyltransferase Ste14
MGGLYVEISAAIWLVWVISWKAASFWRARPTVEAPRNQYRFLFVLIVAGFMLVFGVVPWQFGRLWAVHPWLGWTMVALTALSLAFTWWARIAMGRLWNGGVSRTAEHRVIDTGPFALVRHPIYTGLITAVLTVAVLQARPLALLGAALFALGFTLKARVEERFLAAEFPDYADYCKRVRMIVPFVI